MPHWLASALVLNPVCAISIGELCCYVSPSAIAGLVISIPIDSVNCVTTGALAHVFVKVNERMPSFANGDVRITRTTLASFMHTPPAIPSRGAAFSVSYLAHVDL